jgi:regulatory protein
VRDQSVGPDEVGHATVRELAPVSYLSAVRSASSSAPTIAATVDPESSSEGRGAEPDGNDGGAFVTSISGLSLGSDTPENESEVVDRAVVEQRVLRALGRKALSEKEVRAFISENGLAGPDVDDIVERLVELRYVDDATLAEELTRRLSEKKGQSKSAVGRSLAARGLPSDVVSEALSEIDDGDERRVAFELAEKRARQMGSLDAQTMERRLSGFLARRGYPGGLVRDVVTEIARRSPSARSGPRFR